MSKKPVGGRGQKAPYKTIVVRVPEPIEARVKSEVDLYRHLLTELDLLKRAIASWQESINQKKKGFQENNAKELLEAIVSVDLTSDEQ